MRLKKKLKIMSLLLACLFFLEITPLSLLGGLFLKAFAAASITRTISIDYHPSSQQVVNGTFYGNTSTKAGDIDVTADPAYSGMNIKSITANGVDITPTDAIGKPTYTGQTKPLTGVGVDVFSKHNNGAPGVYTWWRNSGGAGWFADLIGDDDVTHRVQCSYGTTETINGISMPSFPGCNSGDFPQFQTLKLGGQRDQEYRLANDQYIPDASVAEVKSTSYSVNKDDPVRGPAGVPSGKADPDIINITKVEAATPTDPTNYNVFFNMDFRYASPYYFEQSPPDGAKLLSYYMRIWVDFQGKTYQYPTTVTVTYEPAPNAPNLGNIILDEVGNCIQTGSSQAFHVSFTNSGATAITQSFNVEIRIDGVLLKTLSYSSLAAGGTGSGTFDYTFNTSKTITIGIDKLSIESDAANDLDNTAQFPITPQATCGPPPPGPETITGDFHLEHTSIQFGDSNTTYPDNVTVTGGNDCTIAQFGYIFTQNDLVWNTVGPTSTVNTQGFSGPPYPKGMSGGTVSVTMQIVTSCGTTKTVGPKSFDITIPSGNSPPVFNASFFEGGNSFGYPPINQVVVDHYVDLGVIHDPTEQDPKTPYDPDGDGIIYYWDFKGSSDPWIQALDDKFGGWNHDDHYRLIKADVLGTHTVKVWAIDTRGASTSVKNVSIDVVPPNPIPIITLPPKVIEGRTFTPDISCASSYTPYSERTIASCDWHGTKQSIYAAAGDYPIKLDVTDSGGLTSLNPAMDTLHVLVDPPPVIQLNYLNVGIRGSAMTFQDTSTTTLNDPILIHTDQITCDTNNDGSFSDETPITMTPDAGGYFNFTPTQVGNCTIHIFMKKQPGYQRSAAKDFTFTVVNLAPSQDFTAVGVQPQPSNITVVAPSGSALNSWSASGIGQASVPNRYTYVPAEDSLEAQGQPNISPYKSITGNNVNVISIYGYNGGTGSGAGYHFNFPLNHRVSKDTFLYHSGTSFLYWLNLNTLFHSDSASTRYNMEYEFAQNGTASNGSYSYSSLQGINKSSNMYWVRRDSYSSSNQRIIDDDLYHISDLQTSTNPTAFYHITRYVTATWNSDSGWWNAFPEYPGPPSPWVNPLPIDNSSSRTISNRVDTCSYDVDGISSWTTYFTEPSSITADMSGNPYRGLYSRSNCSGGTNGVFLQKLDSNGNILWTSPPFAADLYATHVSVSAIASNNSRILAGALYTGDTSFIGRQGKILDNHTGNVIISDISNILGFYQDIVAYTKESTGRLYFYNLSTGVETISDTINWARGRSVVSSDGRLIVANGITDVRIYDMETTTLATTIAVNLYHLYYGYSPTGLYLTGDGQLIATYEDYEGDGYYNEKSLLITTDTDTSAKAFNYGILSDNKTIYDGDVSVNLKFNDDVYSDLVSSGIVFRRQDVNNMYRVEIGPENMYLVKIVNGTRIVLG